MTIVYLSHLRHIPRFFVGLSTGFTHFLGAVCASAGLRLWALKANGPACLHHESSAGQSGRELIVIRIFHHYVSKMAFMLLMLELLVLLTAAVASAPLWRQGAPSPGASLYPPALAFALVLVFSMGALGMYQHNTLRRILPSFLLGFCLFSLLALSLIHI